MTPARSEIPFEVNTLGDIDAFDNDRDEIVALVFDGAHGEVDNARIIDVWRLWDDRVAERPVECFLHELVDIRVRCIGL